jgi:hypothetical protein
MCSSLSEKLLPMVDALAFAHALFQGLQGGIFCRIDGLSWDASLTSSLQVSYALCISVSLPRVTFLPFLCDLLVSDTSNQRFVS